MRGDPAPDPEDEGDLNGLSQRYPQGSHGERGADVVQAESEVEGKKLANMYSPRLGCPCVRSARASLGNPLGGARLGELGTRRPGSAGQRGIHRGTGEAQGPVDLLGSVELQRTGDRSGRYCTCARKTLPGREIPGGAPTRDLRTCARPACGYRQKVERIVRFRRSAPEVQTGLRGMLGDRNNHADRAARSVAASGSRAGRSAVAFCNVGCSRIPVSRHSATNPSSVPGQ